MGKNGDTNGTNGRDRLATGLGWASNGLAVAQLGAPQRFARAIGVEDDRTARRVLRLVGAREAAAGVGILSRPRPAGWLWARVAGDAMDLALLGLALSGKARSRKRALAATGAVAAIAVVDTVAALREQKGAGQASSARKAVTVRKSAEEVYDYWRDFENFPTFMAHVESVEDGRRPALPLGREGARAAARSPGTPRSPRTSRASGSPGVSLRAPRSRTGAPSASRTPGDQGDRGARRARTGARPAARSATVAEDLRRGAASQLGDDLRRFKQVLETGEVVRSEGSPEGRDPRSAPKQRAARPHETEAEVARR